MSKRSKSVEESGPKAPAYIVTFSDMVTLLLTFFVMLLSIASARDEDFMKRASESFFHQIKFLGMGSLQGVSVGPQREEEMEKHAIEDANDNERDRIISAIEDELRRSFHKVKENTRTMVSQIDSDRTDYSVTDIKFDRGKWALDKASKDWLDRFVEDFGQNMYQGRIDLYVLGLAGDVRKERDQWLVSAKRAEAVAEYLRSSDIAKRNVRIYCWGAGSGGAWVGEDSIVSEQSQIMIAVLSLDGAGN